MKNIKPKKLLFFLVVTCLVLIVWGALCAWLFQTKFIGQNLLPIDLTQLDNSYRSQVRQLMNDYETRAAALDPADYAARLLHVQTALEKLLALRLVKAEKDFHLDLVVAFTTAQNGYTALQNGQTKTGHALVQEAAAQMADLKQTHDWLK
jgi:hypothetical protein